MKLALRKRARKKRRGRLRYHGGQHCLTDHSNEIDSSRLVPCICGYLESVQRHYEKNICWGFLLVKYGKMYDCKSMKCYLLFVLGIAKAASPLLGGGKGWVQVQRYPHCECAGKNGCPAQRLAPPGSTFADSWFRMVSQRRSHLSLFN